MAAYTHHLPTNCPTDTQRRRESEKEGGQYIYMALFDLKVFIFFNWKCPAGQYVVCAWFDRNIIWIYMCLRLWKKKSSVGLVGVCVCVYVAHIELVRGGCWVYMMMRPNGKCSIYMYVYMMCVPCSSSVPSSCDQNVLRRRQQRSRRRQRNTFRLGQLDFACPKYIVCHIHACKNALFLGIISVGPYMYMLRAVIRRCQQNIICAYMPRRTVS